MRSSAWLLLLVFACGPAEHEQACVDGCTDWASVCDYDEEEAGPFCEAECLEDEGGKPADCAECFDCMGTEQGSIYADSTGVDQKAIFCPGGELVSSAPLAFPPVSSVLEAPCFAVCAQCQ